MKSFFCTALVALFFLTGCATPGERYAREHPELPPAHRYILTTGQITDSDSIAGMTKEQVRLALGSPATFDKFNGEDAWIYLHETMLTTASDPTANPTSGMKGGRGSKGGGGRGVRQTLVKKTTVVFHGDRAVEAYVSEDKK